MKYLLGFVLLGIGVLLTGCNTTSTNSLATNPGLFYGAARSAAADGNYQKANAFQTLGDIYNYGNQTSP